MPIDSSLVLGNANAYQNAFTQGVNNAKTNAEIPGIQAQSQVAQASVPYQMQAQQLQNLQLKNQIGLQLLSRATDQDSYDQMLRVGQQYGLDSSMFPPKYDQNFIDKAIVHSMSLDKQLEYQQSQQKIGIDQQNADTDTAKFNADNPNAPQLQPSVRQPQRTMQQSTPTGGMPNTMPQNKIAMLGPNAQLPSNDDSDTPGYVNANIPKPNSAIPIDGNQPAVNISPTPTAGQPIFTPQPSTQGQSQISRMAGNQSAGMQNTTPAVQSTPVMGKGNIPEAVEDSKTNIMVRQPDGTYAKQKLTSLSAQQQTEYHLQRISDLYDQLDKAEGLPETGGDILSNNYKYLQNTGPGQDIGRRAGTESQKIRDEINKEVSGTIFPLMQVVGATPGMERTAQAQENIKSMLSNHDGSSYQAVKENLANLSNQLGLGKVNPAYDPNSATRQPYSPSAGLHPDAQLVQQGMSPQKILALKAKYGVQ